MPCIQNSGSFATALDTYIDRRDIIRVCCIRFKKYGYTLNERTTSENIQKFERYVLYDYKQKPGSIAYGLWDDTLKRIDIQYE